MLDCLQEDQETKRIEETLVEKSRKDEALAQAKEDRKRAKQQDNLQKAAALNDRRKVLQAEEQALCEELAGLMGKDMEASGANKMEAWDNQWEKVYELARATMKRIVADRT